MRTANPSAVTTYISIGDDQNDAMRAYYFAIFINHTSYVVSYPITAPASLVSIIHISDGDFRLRCIITPVIRKAMNSEDIVSDVKPTMMSIQFDT